MCVFSHKLVYNIGTPFHKQNVLKQEMVRNHFIVPFLLITVGLDRIVCYFHIDKLCTKKNV